MSTEFNYVVKLDTTSVMGSLAEVRNQVGMAFGGMGGGGAGTQMMKGLERGMLSGFGRTHTDPAMAYDPHYGQVHATTSMNQEKAVARYGLAAAEALRPPGVGAGEYAMGVHSNAIDRQQGARHDAKMAAQSTFYSGAAGLGAAEGAFLMAGAAGKVMGKGIASRFFGGGKSVMKAGGLIGGIGLGVTAAMMAEEYVGGRIRDHYAEVEQIGGMTEELGDIVGGGRGLSRTDQYKTGIAAREAAKDINMDGQQMGAIASLGRATGLLPSTTDPSKLRSQLGDLAKAVDEGASALHTSLGNAAMVLRSAAKQGISGEEGILRAGAAGGAEQYLANQARAGAFGNAGGQFAMQQRLSHKQGFDMFTGAMGQAAGASMSTDARKILGGNRGTAQLMAAGQIGAATSPLGDLQLMAAAGGHAGGSLMDLPGQAMSAMNQGGDFVSNMMKFQVHKDELRRGIGAKGIRTMAQQQLVAGGEMMKMAAPNLTDREARSMFAQSSMGMDPTQAWAYAGMGKAGGGGGGGGKSDAAYARRLDTYQDMQMHRSGLTALGKFEAKGAENFSEGYGFGSGFMYEGAALGAMSGAGPLSLPGALIGGAAGLIAGNAKAAYNLAGDLFGGGGPGLGASPQEKADFYKLQDKSEYDAKIQDFKDNYGTVDLNMDVAARIKSAPLRSTQLNGNEGMSAMARARYGGAIAMSGVSSVEAGPGNLTLGGKSYNVNALRRSTNQLSKPPKYTKDAIEASNLIAGSDDEDVQRALRTFRNESKNLLRNDFNPAAADSTISAEAAANAIQANRQGSIDRRAQAAGVLMHASGNADLIEDFESSGMVNREVRATLYSAVGLRGREPNYNLREQRDVNLTTSLQKRRAQADDMFAGYMANEFMPAPRGRSEGRRMASYEAISNSKYMDAAISAGSSQTWGLLGEEGYKDTMPGGARAFIRAGIRKKGAQEFLGEMDGQTALAAKSILGLGNDATAANMEDEVSRGGGRRDFANKLMKTRDWRKAIGGKGGPDYDEMAVIAERVGKGFDDIGSPTAMVERMRNSKSKAGLLEKGAAGITGADGIDAKEILGSMEFGKEAQKFGQDARDAGERPQDPSGGARGKGGKGPAPLAHSIGFGQQESAMTTINRSLRRTHDMLAKLERGMGKVKTGKKAGKDAE
jgi:hypothetical protein